MAAIAAAGSQSATRRPRTQDVDRHVGDRMRQRRIMLGLTQQQLADLIGVTYQQAHKYERGINRIAGGRLYTIAQALGVEVAFFFEGIGAPAGAGKPTAHQRLLLELTRNFVAIADRRQQEAICNLARSLAASEELAASGMALAADDAMPCAA